MFNKYKNGHFISGKVIKTNTKKLLFIFNFQMKTHWNTFQVATPALGEVMGRAFNEEETSTFIEIVDLKEVDQICLKTWLGLCAFSERFYGMYSLIAWNVKFHLFISYFKW